MFSLFIREKVRAIMYLLYPETHSDTHVPSFTLAKLAGLSFSVLLLVRMRT